MSNIQFFIKTLTGKTITCNVNTDEPILNMKQQIFEKEGIPIDQQKIIFLGEELENHRLLNDYKYQKDVMAHLIIKLN